jgi:hypothetical protein
MAKRIVMDISTGEQHEEEFELIPPPTPPTARPEVVRARAVEMIRSATSLDDLKRALLLYLGELEPNPNGTLA